MPVTPAPPRRCQFKGCRERAAPRKGSGRGRLPKYCEPHKREAKREQDRRPRGIRKPPPECCRQWRQSAAGKADKYNECPQHRGNRQAVQRDRQRRHYVKFESNSQERKILLEKFGPYGGYHIDPQGSHPEDD